MRLKAFAFVSACVVAACNPSAPGGGGGLFPDLTSGSYRAEATTYTENGETMPVVMIRSGNKLRMEVSSAEGDMAIVNDGDSGESFVLMTQGGRTMAMRAPPTSYTNPAETWNAELASTATRTGSCSVAGEGGSEWTRTEETGEVSSACVTDDGIILRAQEGDRVTWETTSVQRGPQSADLFVLPPGVQVMDLGAMMGPSMAPGAGGGGQMCQTLRDAGAPADALARAGC